MNPTGSKCSGIESLEWYGYGQGQGSTVNSAVNLDTANPVNPVNPLNLSPPQSAAFKLNCFQTATGLKLLLLSTPRQPQLDYILRRLHEIYADYALKNPFQTPEMPVRSEKFEAAVGRLVKQMSVG